MGYRPRYKPDHLSVYNRENEIKELNSQRANYVFLLNEMSPVPGDPVDVSFREAIADVDARIAELNPLPPRGPSGQSGVVPGRLGPVNRSILQNGHFS